MNNVVECKTTEPSGFPQTVVVRAHTFHADVGESEGSTDTAPGPHDYFDAALASCKSLTATWYAKQKGFPLERVEARVERDNSQERAGTYTLRVHLQYFGPLTHDQLTRLHAAVARCPIHKLMTTTDVVIETAPLPNTEPAQP